MIIDHQGHSYTTTMGSDLDRDGMSLELVVDDRSAAPVLEIFYSDVTHSFTITALQPVSLPLEIIEELIREAHTRLPPAPDDSQSAATSTI